MHLAYPPPTAKCQSECTPPFPVIPAKSLPPVQTGAGIHPPGRGAGDGFPPGRGNDGSSGPRAPPPVIPVQTGIHPRRGAGGMTHVVLVR